MSHLHLGNILNIQQYLNDLSKTFTNSDAKSSGTAEAYVNNMTDDVQLIKDIQIIFACLTELAILDQQPLFII